MVGVWYGAEFLEEMSTRLKDVLEDLGVSLVFQELLVKEDLLA